MPWWMMSVDGVQQSVLGHRGRKLDPLYATRRLMTRGWERLTQAQVGNLLSCLEAGDPEGEVAASILAKELLREVYAAKTLREAYCRLQEFYSYAARADVDELTRLSRTISRWEEQIVNFNVTHISTGPVEAQNLITEKIRRIGHGFEELRQLSPASFAAFRCQMANSSNDKNTGTPPRLIA